MNVTYVWDGDYPWDIRADKVCTTLVDAGHDVHIACRNLARQSPRDRYRGSEIHRLPALPAWAGRLNSAVSFPAFFSPFWIWHIWRVARRTEADVIVVRDLPMALAGMLVARILGVPCALDMAECYPELVRCVWEFEGRSLKNYLIRNPKLADLVESLVFRNIDQVWVMVEESETRALALGVEQDRIRIISNTPVVSRFPAAEEGDGDGRSGPLRVIYVGLLNPSRGVDVAIRAVARYAQTDPSIRFTVVGSGKAEEELHRLVRELDVSEHVEFLGWVDNDRVPALLADADVGLVPHRKCTHWDSTIPNKLFDYMAAGIPVVVSNVVPMKRIVEETSCGRDYEDPDIDSFVDALRPMKDPAVRAGHAENGRMAVERRYNWEHERGTLLRAMDDLGSAAQSG